MVDQASNKSQIPDIKCKIHQDFQIDYLNLNTDAKNLLVCSQCVQSQKTNNNQLVVLKEFFSNNPQKVITNWPPMQDQTLKEQLNSKELLTEKRIVLTSQITQLFNQFRKEISNIIDVHEKKVLDQIDLIEFSRDTLLQEYNKISDKEEVLGSFLSKQCNLEELEESLRSLVLKKQKQSQQIEQLLRYSLDNLTKNEQKYSLDHFQELTSQIKQSLISIDFLSVHEMQIKQQDKQIFRQEIVEVDFGGNLSLFQDYQRFKIKLRYYFCRIY